MRITRLHPVLVAMLEEQQDWLLREGLLPGAHKTSMRAQIWTEGLLAVVPTAVTLGR